ncbi:MAG: LEA type 2 family protein [Ginsengibacter sp.]
MRNSIIFLYLFFGLTLSALLSCSAPKALVYNDYRNFSIDKLGFTSSEVRLDLEYYNPNNFGLQLKRTELDIFINNTFLGHSASDSLINIPRRDTFLIPIKFTADMHNLFKNALTTLAGNEVLIKVNGKIKVGKANVFMSMPITYEGKHKFSLF